MTQLKVCPICKEKDLTFYFFVLLKQEGCILINDANEESFELSENDWEKEEITLSTPVDCSCGWMGLVKHLLTIEEDDDG